MSTSLPVAAVEECAVQLQQLASACDFTEQRNRSVCEQYAEQLTQLHHILTECAPHQLSTIHPDSIAILVALPVDAVVGGLKPLPQLVTEVWGNVLRALLCHADLALRRSPRVTAIVGKLTDAIRALSKDRSDVGPRACCLDAAQQLLAAFLASDVASNGLLDTPLLPTQLAHPVKSVAQAPRLSSMALVPHIMRLAFTQQLPTTQQPPQLAQQGSAELATWIGLFPQDWLVYIRKGMDAKDFAIKEASVQCLSECLKFAVLPEAHNAAVVDALVRIADGSFTSPKLLASVSRALGEILAHQGVGADAASMLRSGGGTGQSYWGGLWKTTQPQVAPPAALPPTACSSAGDPWSVLNGLIKPPMTKTMQTTLGDAVGHFLWRCSTRRPQWYSSAAAKLMPMVFPTSMDNRAYAPKIVIRAVGLWCDTSASVHYHQCDTYRQSILASLIPYMKADLPKQVAQTALACMNHLLGAIRCLRSDLATQLFAMTKALAITMTHVASAASEVCARTASFDIGVQHALFRMHSDLMEDVTRDAPLTHAFVGVSKVLLALPVCVLVRHHATVLEVYYANFWNLGDLRTAGEDDAGATSEALARRWELAHQFAQAIIAAARSNPNVFYLSKALRSAVVARCHEHVSKLASWAKAAAHQAWLRMALAVSTTMRNAAEWTYSDDDPTVSATLASSLVATLRAAVPHHHASAAVSSSSSGNHAGTVLYVKLRAELFCGVSLATKRCEEKDGNCGESSSPLAHGRNVKFLAAVALQEVRNAVAAQCPCFRADHHVFPASIAPLMSTCRRTTPAVHQQPSAATIDAALDMLAISFAHPKSPQTHRVDIIRGLFDVLAAPCPDTTIARWNVVCALERVLERDATSIGQPEAVAGGPWKHLDSTAQMLRAQLVQQFLSCTTLDVQCVAAKALAHLARLVGDTEAVVSKAVIDAPTVTDPTLQCGTLLLFGECCGTNSAVQSLPLVTSHVVTVLRQPSGLFGDPCSGMAIAATTCVILMARLHGHSVARDIFNAHLQHAFYLKPSANAIDPLVKSLLWGAMCRVLSLRGSCTHDGDSVGGGDGESVVGGGTPALCSAVYMSLTVWGTALTAVVDPSSVKSIVQLIKDCVSSNNKRTSSALGMPDASGAERVLLALLLPLRTTVGVGTSVAEAILSMNCANALTLKDIAQRVDASRDAEERLLWTRVGEAHVASTAGYDDATTLKSLAAIITAKAPMHLADDGGDDAPEDLTALNARKSEAYGEDVADVTPSTVATAASNHHRSVTTRASHSSDVPAKEAAARWLVVLLRLSSRRAAAHAPDFVEDVLRIMCMVASLADVHNNLVGAATHLVTWVTRAFFQKPLEAVGGHGKPAVFMTTYRTQVSGAVKQLARAVSVDPAGCQDACDMCAAYASSSLADDVTVGRMAQAVINRIGAVEDHTTLPQRSCGDGTRLMAILARLVQDALQGVGNRGSAPQWPSVLSAVRLAMATQSVQEVLHRISIAIMVAIGDAPRSRLGHHRVAVDSNETYTADGAAINDFFELLLTAAPVADESAPSDWMGPTLRHSVGACACVVVGDVVARDEIVVSEALVLNTIKAARLVQYQQQEALIAMLAHALDLQARHKKNATAARIILEALLPLSNAARASQLLRGPLLASCALNDEQVDWILIRLLARDHVVRRRVASRSTPSRLLAMRAMYPRDFDAVVCGMASSGEEQEQGLGHRFVRSLVGASQSQGNAIVDALVSLRTMENKSLLELSSCLVASFPMALPQYLVAACALRVQDASVADLLMAIALPALSAMTRETDVWGNTVLSCAAAVARSHHSPEGLQSIATLIANALQHDPSLRNRIPLLPSSDREELRALMSRIPTVAPTTVERSGGPSSAPSANRIKLAINIQKFT